MTIPTVLRAFALLLVVSAICAQNAMGSSMSSAESSVSSGPTSSSAASGSVTNNLLYLEVNSTLTAQGLLSALYSALGVSSTQIDFDCAMTLTTSSSGVSVRNCNVTFVTAAQAATVKSKADSNQIPGVISASYPGATTTTATATTTTTQAVVAPVGGVCTYTESEINTKISACVSAYTTGGIDNGNICVLTSTLMGCYGDLFSCNPVYASQWNSSISSYVESWKTNCKTIPAIAGVAEPSLVFGDPHYRLTNGSYQTCNDLGENILALSKFYSVTVVHSGIGSDDGAVVTSVTVELFHVGAPTGTFTWNLTDSPADVSLGGVSVTAAGIDASALGLNLKVTKNTDHLVIGTITKQLTGGILLNGCSSPSSVPSTDNVTGPCADVPKAFQAICLFDSVRVGPTWAASSSTAASTEEASLVATAQSENGVAAPLFAVLSALLAVASTVAMLL